MPKIFRMLEINTIVWLHELSETYQKRIRLSDIPEEELLRFAETGFDSVWLMGIWKRSPLGREIFISSPEFGHYIDLFRDVLPGVREDDIYGSPYSIQAYEPDPLIGDWDGLDRVRSILNRYGMRLIVDFVPNHTAPDHPWVTQHPDYYIRGDESHYRERPSDFTPLQIDGRVEYFARGKDPHFPAWSDTLQLNHFNTEMRMALLEEVKRISPHADGFRCDMAMLVLNDIFNWHWQWAIPYNVHQPQQCEFWTMLRYSIPDKILIAEAYWDTEWTLQQLGFDYVYDKRLYDRLKGADLYGLKLHLQAEISFQQKLLRFIENHDEDRAASVFGPEALKTAAVIFSTVPGLKLFHHGQLEGRRKKIPLQLKRVAPEPANEGLREFYNRLLRAISHPLFMKGKWKMVPLSETEGTISYLWEWGHEFILVVVNYSETPATIVIPWDHIPERESMILEDLLKGEGEEFHLHSGQLKIHLHGYEFRILYGLRTL